MAFYCLFVENSSLLLSKTMLRELFGLNPDGKGTDDATKTLSCTVVELRGTVASGDDSP